MYAGTTISRKSGRIVGVHQKINRVALKGVKRFFDPALHFPHIADILHFEGSRGPDGVKRKSPGRDEPWHFIDPSNPSDIGLIVDINNHMHNLTRALERNNYERASFEAAWLSHAIVDGLTPAHHYPLNTKIEELWGKPHHERTSVLDKNLIRGNGSRDTLSKNWQYWGTKGVFTAHVAFEWGVATTITGHQFHSGRPTPADIKRVELEGFDVIFEEELHTIYAMNLYEIFIKNGWTHEFADRIRKELLPRIIKTVALAWYYAEYSARKDKA